MRIHTKRIGLAAMLGIAVGVGAVTLAPIPGERAEAQVGVPVRQGVPVYAMDRVHSSVVFGIKHMDLAWFFGRFNDFEGAFNLDPNDVENSYLTMTIKTDSVDTGHDGRNEHVRSPDYFNTKVYPEATFNSTSVQRDGDRLSVTGELMMNGKVKAITVPVEITGSGERRGKMCLGFLCEFTFDRTDFGYGWNPAGLGEEVRMIVSMEGVKTEAE